MEKRGISSLSLAMLAGSSPTTVLRVRKGKNIEVVSLADIAGALGCRVRFVLEEEN